jgi:rare lipoprotein A
LQMNKQAGMLTVMVMVLTACASPPPRQVGVQAAAPVADAKSMPLESTTPSMKTAGMSTSLGAAPSPETKPAVQTVQPGHGGYLEGDGPGIDAPPNLEATPDAVPRNEPLHRYANRPYVALGQTFTPLTAPGNYKEHGIASWYGKKFHGQHTSSGETYDMYGMTAAHPTLPIPSYARVTNLTNNKSVVVRVNDRGPFLHDRIMDLSYTAAYKLGLVGKGSSQVEVESIALDAAAISPPIAMNDPVTIEPLAPAAVATQAVVAQGNHYLQLGAFKSQQSAESFLAKMRVEFDGSGKQVVLFQKDELVRVHIGPYASLDEARANAERLQPVLGFKPLVSPH